MLLDCFWYKEPYEYNTVQKVQNADKNVKQWKV